MSDLDDSMSPRRLWYARALPADAHLADEKAPDATTVTAVCGATFVPLVVFTNPNQSAQRTPPPPDSRFCKKCRAVTT